MTLAPTTTNACKQDVLLERDLCSKAIPTCHNMSALQNQEVPSSHFANNRHWKILRHSVLRCTSLRIQHDCPWNMFSEVRVPGTYLRSRNINNPKKLRRTPMREQPWQMSELQKHKKEKDENHDTFTRSVLARWSWLLEIGTSSDEAVGHSTTVSTIREFNRRTSSGALPEAQKASC
jgi:hypothetical protein